MAPLMQPPDGAGGPGRPGCCTRTHLSTLLLLMHAFLGQRWLLLPLTSFGVSGSPSVAAGLGGCFCVWSLLVLIVDTLCCGFVAPRAMRLAANPLGDRARAWLGAACMGIPAAVALTFLFAPLFAVGLAAFVLLYSAGVVYFSWKFGGDGSFGLCLYVGWSVAEGLAGLVVSWLLTVAATSLLSNPMNQTEPEWAWLANILTAIFVLSWLSVLCQGCACWAIYNDLHGGSADAWFAWFQSDNELEDQLLLPDGRTNYGQQSHSFAAAKHTQQQQQSPPPLTSTPHLPPQQSNRWQKQLLNTLSFYPSRVADTALVSWAILLVVCVLGFWGTALFPPGTPMNKAAHDDDSCVASCYCDGANPATTAVLVVRDLQYGSGSIRVKRDGDFDQPKMLLLDLYHIDDSAGTHSARARPAMIVMHGGSFWGGAKNDSFVVDEARYYALHGFVAVSIE